MRVASKKPNTLKLYDNVSNSSHHQYYRTPTAKEVADYTNGMTKRVKNRIVNCTGECRQKNGRKILKGFRTGDFGIEENGKVVVVSSDPEHPKYRSDWKELYCKYCADLVERLAIHVFEGSADLDDGVEMTGEDSDGKETSDPNES